MKAKSMLPTPADLTLDDIQSRFSTDETARQYLEEIRWPGGVVCPHCKNADQSRIWGFRNGCPSNRASCPHDGITDKQDQRGVPWFKDS